MKLEQQVVSLELAKKLKELGVKQESLFSWVYSERMSVDVKRGADPDKYTLKHGAPSKYYSASSAFTVAELGEMLPWKVLVNDERQVLSYSRGNEEQSDGFQWMVSYSPIDENDLRIVSTCDSTEADARAKMLIYLLENKLI